MYRATQCRRTKRNLVCCIPLTILSDEVQRSVEGFIEKTEIALYAGCLAEVAADGEAVSLSASQSSAKRLNLLIIEEVKVQICEPSDVGHRA